MKSSSPYVLGIDGGGTKTVAWLALLAVDGSEDILGRGQAGPGNPRAAGFETAQANIETAIAAQSSAVTVSGAIENRDLIALLLLERIAGPATPGRSRPTARRPAELAGNPDLARSRSVHHQYERLSLWRRDLP